MERHDRNALMSELPSEFAAEILQAMSPDNAANIKEVSIRLAQYIYGAVESV